jgi:hypothetical protein
MYSDAAPNSPALALQLTFEGPAGGRIGTSVTSYHGNANVIPHSRILSGPQIDTFFDPLGGDSWRQDEHDFGASSQVSPVKHDVLIKEREERIASLLVGDNNIQVWLDFTTKILKLLFDILGFDISDADGLPDVALELWNNDDIRAAITAFGEEDASDAPLPEVVENRMINFTTVCWAQRKFNEVYKAVSDIAFWIWLNLVNGIGKLLRAIHDAIDRFVTLVDELRRTLDHDPENHRQAALVVSWAGGSVSQYSNVPLLIGPTASTQDFTVRLQPPPSRKAATVTISCSELSAFELSNTSFTFPKGDTSSRTLSVRCITQPTRFSPRIEFRFGSAAGNGIVAGLDPKVQSIGKRPENIAFDLDEPTQTQKLTLWMHAIIDRPDTVTLELAEVLVVDDPAPTKKLKIEFQGGVSALSFNRQGDTQHKSNEIDVLVSLVPKDPLPLMSWETSPTRSSLLGGEKRKVVEAVGVQTRSMRARSSVAVRGTHTTTITMVQAGKGDSYIISDQRGARQPWGRVLIDGGVTGTCPRIYNALRRLTGRANIADVILDALICTHYDDDHIRGSIDDGQTTFISQQS